MDYNPAEMNFLAQKRVSPVRGQRPASSANVAAALLLMCSLVPPIASGQRPHSKERGDVAKFRARVEKILSDAKVAKGHWGILVADAGTGETLYERNADSYFTPASNTKLFTTGLALAKLGPDYRFRTTLETRGTLDAHGRLHGDLILVGRGDPNLSARKLPYDVAQETDGPPERVLAELVERALAVGIREIEGQVIADDSFFPYERYPVGWAIGDMLWRYGAPISALAVNDNVITLELRPGAQAGEPAWLGVEPWAEFYEIENTVTTGTAGSKRELRVHREPGSRRIEVSGSLPAGQEPHKLNLAVEEPAEHAAALLKRLLEARGVRVYGEARAQHGKLPALGVPPELSAVPGGGVAGTESEADATPAVVLAEHYSISLVEVVRVINKVSQNLHTEMLLRTVAREVTGDGSTESALKLAEEFYREAGIGEKDVALDDGSGLSRQNLVTPRATVTLLRWVAQQPWGDAFRGALPLAGTDGTLEERLRKLPPRARIQAKTGTLGNVNALAGYAETAHGAKLVFAVYGNLHNLRGREATSPIDAIAIAMVEEIGATKR